MANSAADLFRREAIAAMNEAAIVEELGHRDSARGAVAAIFVLFATTVLALAVFAPITPYHKTLGHVIPGDRLRLRITLEGPIALAVGDVATANLAILQGNRQRHLPVIATTFRRIVTADETNVYESVAGSLPIDILLPELRDVVLEVHIALNPVRVVDTFL